jgi:hypothetical protein
MRRCASQLISGGRSNLTYRVEIGGPGPQLDSNPVHYRKNFE